MPRLRTTGGYQLLRLRQIGEDLGIGFGNRRTCNLVGVSSARDRRQLERRARPQLHEIVVNQSAQKIRLAKYLALLGGG